MDTGFVRRLLLTVVWTLCATLPGSRAGADYPARCDATPPAGMAAPAAAGCCNNSDVTCPTDTSGLVRKGTVNIVVVVSDDQGFCQYGFMHGRCKNSTTTLRSCRTNIDCCDTPGNCPADAVCLRDASRSTGPLRLSDWACRYRQPPSPKKLPTSGKYKPCEGVSGRVKAPDANGDRKAFPFDSHNYPCAHTMTTAYDGQQPTPRMENPVPLTPNLDRLATQGTLFTRAHVGGNACKSSRATIMYGKHHRHMLELVDGDTHPPTVAHWLPSRYVKVLMGKGEIVTETEGGWKAGLTKSGPAFGRFKCANPGDCQSAVETAAHDLLPDLMIPNVPLEARRGIRGTEVIFDPLYSYDPAAPVIDSDCTPYDKSCQPQWKRPFLLWVAPKMPHLGGAGQSYEGLYAGFGPKAQLHHGRVTQLDVLVGAVEDELKRSCVCVRDAAGYASRESLWDNTVLIFLTDHGFFLPDAKRAPTENTHRTPLIISDPRHRGIGPALSPALYENELANSIDVLNTVVAYAENGIPVSPPTPGGPPTLTPFGTPTPTPPGFPLNPVDPTSTRNRTRGYSHSRNLRPFVELSGTPTPLRRLQYGEDANQGRGFWGEDRRPDRSHYMINRPGELGVCVVNPTPGAATPVAVGGAGLGAAHVRVCLEDGDCAGGVCRKDWGRCVNDPAKACHAHDDCAPAAACDGTNHCAFVTGSLADFAPPPTATPGATPGLSGGYKPRTCGTAVDCIPQDSGSLEGVDLCRPVILKAESIADGEIVRVWDLDWDPDQHLNLVSPTPAANDYLGSIRTELTDCLRDFYHVDNSNKWTPRGSTTCPSDWQETP